MAEHATQLNSTIEQAADQGNMLYPFEAAPGNTEATLIATLENKINELETMYQHVRWVERTQKRQDTAERNDPDTRLMMLKVITALDELLTDYAGFLAVEKGQTDFFATDRYKEILLWQLGEFLTRSDLDRDDEFYATIPKAHQLTRYHAAHWFNVQVDDFTGIDTAPELEGGNGQE